jgi:hypothetical protein
LALKEIFLAKSMGLFLGLMTRTMQVYQYSSPRLIVPFLSRVTPLIKPDLSTEIIKYYNIVHSIVHFFKMQKG